MLEWLKFDDDWQVFRSHTSLGLPGYFHVEISLAKRDVGGRLGPVGSGEKGVFSIVEKVVIVVVVRALDGNP